MTKGIFLIAHGKKGYIYAAYNLAVSLKYFNPEIKISLLHDDSIDYLSEDQKRFFDILIKFNPAEDPGEIKLGMYDKLPFDYNLYLDVDSIALRDLTPVINELIEKGGSYYSHVSGVNKGEESFPELMWATPKQIREKYNLTSDSPIPSINTSFQFIKKCQKSKELFDQALINLFNPIPLNELKTRWGGTQPDELYLNVALSQKNINADPGKEYVFFSSKIHAELSSIERDFALLTLYGGRGFIRLAYIEWYDRLMHKYCRSFGFSHSFKTRNILPDKHVNK